MELLDSGVPLRYGEIMDKSRLNPSGDGGIVSGS
jgi:hypothetical protein